MCHRQRSSARYRAPRLAAALVAALLLAALAGPAVGNSGPTSLLDPSIDPPTATPATTITFSVSYRNREGSPADFVRVLIGGVAHEMTAAPGQASWKTGVAFSHVAKLSAGSHEIVFEAQSRDRFSDRIVVGILEIGGTTGGPTPTPTPISKPAPSPTPPASATPKPNPTPTATSKPPAGPGPGATATPRSTTGSPAADPPIVGPGSIPGSPIVPDGSPTPTDGPSGPSAPASPVPDHDDPSDDATDDPTASAWTGGPGRGAPRGPQLVDWSDPGALASGLFDVGIGGQRLTPFETAPVLVGTTGAVTMGFAFGLFHRRRRDGEQPASDEALSAAAANGSGIAGSADLVPGPGPVPVPDDPEANIPRWRRPSLIQARKLDPSRMEAPEVVHQTFHDGSVAPEPNREIRLIRYTVVRLLDVPDELRGGELGVLDQGDEVQVLGEDGVFRFVLAPDGRRGWIHRMTLGDPVEPDTGEAPEPTEDPGAAELDLAEVLRARSIALGHLPPAAAAPEPEVDAEVIAAFLTARRRLEA